MRIATFATIAISLFLLLGASVYAQDIPDIKITNVTGAVFVKIYPSSEWTPAAAAQALKKMDSVKTDAGKAVIEFPDKSSVTLKPGTQISIEELVWDNAAKKIGLNMTSGELKAVVNKLDKAAEFKVRTPTAICGARGTVFYVVVFPDGTGVYVEQGLVDFLSTISGQSYTIYEGTRSDSMNNGSITQPQRLTKEEVDKMIADYDMKPVAEPYTEPEGAGGDNLNPPEVLQETPASGS